MKKLSSLISLLLLFISTLFAQVGINTDGTMPDNSAMLDVKSTTKGFLPPRVALTATNSADPVTDPAIGLLVYNTATAGTPPNNVVPGYHFWNGSGWISVATPQGTNVGDMLYWNGMQWVRVPVGTNGQSLILSNSIPAWGTIEIPVIISTAAVSSIYTTTAGSSGNVIYDGGAIVTERGVCWSTAQNPTFADNHTSDGNGMGVFTSAISGLAPNTSYYLKAYATNNMGTAYGNQVNFLSLSSCGSITINHQVAGGVAPIDKMVTYGTVTNMPGELSKCWITSNLGADHQATTEGDYTEASAGWYWQFNRMQGFKHTGAQPEHPIAPG